MSAVSAIAVLQWNQLCWRHVDAKLAPQWRRRMFEGLRWHRAQNDTQAAMKHAAESLAQAGRIPLVIGSLVAVAAVGMLTRMGFNGRGRHATVIPARFRSSGADAMSSPRRNGRRRRKRKMKAAAH
jgi:hypothetical protein